jgi:beta-lactam-binding protein with PASTA domain
VRRLPQFWLLALLIAVGVLITRQVAMSPDAMLGAWDTIRHGPPLGPGRSATPRPSPAPGLPALTGLPIADAQRELSMRRLRVDAFPAIAPRVPEGTVVSQSPAPGTLVPPRSLVHLGVAGRPLSILVPPLQGQTEEDATHRLEALDLVPKIKRRHSFRVDPGDVMETNPPAGIRLRPGAAVEVEVSDGRFTGHVAPDVVGLSYDDALSQAGQAGMVLEATRQAGDPDSLVVKSQNPPPGTPLEDPPPALQVMLAAPPAPSPDGSKSSTTPTSPDSPESP